MAQLPEDGDLPNLRSITIESSSCVEQQHSDENPCEAHLSQSFVPRAARLAAEQETVRHSIQDRQTGATTSTPMWPSIGGRPINEFKTEGYICQWRSLPFSQPMPQTFLGGVALKSLLGTILSIYSCTKLVVLLPTLDFVSLL